MNWLSIGLIMGGSVAFAITIGIIVFLVKSRLRNNVESTAVLLTEKNSSDNL
jgi:hypothetical protein